MTDGVRRRVLERASESAIEGDAIESGMVSDVRRWPLPRLCNGETTIEEVLRVTRIS